MHERVLEVNQSWALCGVLHGYYVDKFSVGLYLGDAGSVMSQDIHEFPVLK